MNKLGKEALLLAICAVLALIATTVKPIDRFLQNSKFLNYTAFFFIAGCLVRKSGVSTWNLLLAITPCANLLWIFVMNHIDWPIEKELSVHRLEAGSFSPHDVERVFRMAVDAERSKDFELATELYQLVQEHHPDQADIELISRRLRDFPKPS